MRRATNDSLIRPMHGLLASASMTMPRAPMSCIKSTGDKRSFYVPPASQHVHPIRSKQSFRQYPQENILLARASPRPLPSLGVRVPRSFPNDSIHTLSTRPITSHRVRIPISTVYVRAFHASRRNEVGPVFFLLGLLKSSSALSIAKIGKT